MAESAPKKDHDPVGGLIIIALCVAALAYVAWPYLRKDDVYCIPGPDCTQKMWIDLWLPSLVECEAKGDRAYGAAMWLKSQRELQDFPGAGTPERNRVDLCILARGV